MIVVVVLIVEVGVSVVRNPMIVHMLVSPVILDISVSSVTKIPPHQLMTRKNNNVIVEMAVNPGTKILLVMT
jgi:hypothetical protein